MSNNKELPHITLANLSRGYVLSRAIHTVAQLGVANHMSTQPTSVQQLAAETGTKPDLLDRLLRFLSAYNLFQQDEDTYALTPLSMPLRDDDPHSIRAVLCMVDEYWWQAFSQMDSNLKTGNSGFFHQHGDDFFTFLGKSPAKQKNFDEGMAKLSSYDDDTISKAFNFGKFAHLIDMGGGRGGLSHSLAALYPKLKVTLFDSPVVINQLKPETFSSRVILKAGDFFATIPQAEAYIFKGVLHDFSDEMMIKILSNCAAQMPDKATLFITEQVMPETPEPHPNKTMDIVMMVLLGGRQRTLKEWQQCISTGGFKFEASYKTDSVFTVMSFKKSV